MSKPVRVVLLEDADTAYKSLSLLVARQRASGKTASQEISLLNSIDQKISFIKSDPFYGDSVQKKLIPELYTRQFGAYNLFRAELFGYWRLIYTLKGDDLEVIAFILDIISHPEYNKRFGYRKR